MPGMPGVGQQARSPSEPHGQDIGEVAEWDARKERQHNNGAVLRVRSGERPCSRNAVILEESGESIPSSDGQGRRDIEWPAIEPDDVAVTLVVPDWVGGVDSLLAEWIEAKPSAAVARSGRFRHRPDFRCAATRLVQRRGR